MLPLIRIDFDYFLEIARLDAHSQAFGKILYELESLAQHKTPNTACTRRVGVAAFSSSLCGLRLVPSKRPCPVPPTRG